MKQYNQNQQLHNFYTANSQQFASEMHGKAPCKLDCPYAVGATKTHARTWMQLGMRQLRNFINMYMIHYHLHMYMHVSLHATA